MVQTPKRTTVEPPPAGSAADGYLAPPEVNVRISRAEELVRQRRKAEARTILADTERYAVKNPRFWWAKARAAGSRAEAVAALRRVIALRPKDDAAWTTLRRLDSGAARELAIQRGHAFPDEQPGKPKPPLRQRLSRRARVLVFALVAAVILTVLAIAVISGGLAF